MSDLKDRLELSRKERVKKLLEKMKNKEYLQEAKEDANDYIGEAYDSLSEEEREEFAEKEKLRKRKKQHGY